MQSRVRKNFKRIRHFAHLTRRIGFKAAVCYFRKSSEFRKPGEEFLIRPAGLRYPLVVRTGTSDPDVFFELFIRGIYDSLVCRESPGFIVDCGGNAGYFSALFLSRYPECRIVAVEPDPENYRVLSRNLEPYGEQAITIQAGVWSRREPLRIAEDPFRDGREWARQVRSCREGETESIPGIDISSLLDDLGWSRISLLKVDIEGAEAEVFSAGCESWLRVVDVVAVETHEDSSFGDTREIVEKKIRDSGFEISQVGDLIVGRAIRAEFR